MRQIPLGAKGTATLRVLPEHLANRFKDAILPQVLATPVMVLVMENAALNAIRPHLDAGESAAFAVVHAGEDFPGEVGDAFQHASTPGCKIP